MCHHVANKNIGQVMKSGVKGSVRLGRSLFSLQKKASDDLSTKTSHNMRYFATLFGDLELY